MLFIVLAGSVVGITAMVLLNMWLGLSEPARLRDLDDAVARLDTDSVGYEAGEGGLVTPDGLSALIPSRDGRTLGLLVARGSDFVIRYLGPGSVRAAEADADGSLQLRLNDFTFAPARLNFSSADQAQFWAERLNALKG